MPSSQHKLKILKTESERKYFSYSAMVKIVGSGSNYPEVLMDVPPGDPAQESCDPGQVTF